jgi:transposase InsO family protein
MVHANAPLTPVSRLRVARHHVEDGATLRATADRFQVSTTTVVRWSTRYRQVLAQGRQPTTADMADGSSRPRHSPTRTPARLERKVVHLRGKKRLGPVAIAARVGLPASTVHAVLVRRGLNRLTDLDQATGAKIRAQARASRYERPAAGDLVHLDVKKTPRIPDGGVVRLPSGQRLRAQPRKQRRPNQAVTAPRVRYVHTALDDHSRLAYSEVLDNEQGVTAAAFWRRAKAFFAGHGITVAEVLTDNGACYTSREFAAALGSHIKHRRTRPYRPQTNGKVERFHRTMAREWLYAKVWRSDSAREAALRSWLKIYNHHRPHTALAGRPPISRTPTATQAA